MEVTGDDGIRRADHRAGGLEVLLDPVGTEVAFLYCAQVLVEVDGVIGAGLHAGTAADAGITIDVDDAVLAFFKGIDRADRHAWGIRAVIAPLDEKMPLDGGEGPLLDVLHGCPEIPNGHVVFRLAGNGTGVAADAVVVVDYEPVLHWE